MPRKNFLGKLCRLLSRSLFRGSIPEGKCYKNGVKAGKIDRMIQEEIVMYK